LEPRSLLLLVLLLRLTWGSGLRALGLLWLLEGR
jgi:hypothetical protein